MDDIRDTAAAINANCNAIQTMITNFHGKRTKSVGEQDAVTLPRDTVRRLVQALHDLDVLTREVIKRVAGVEEIVLTQLHEKLDDPTAPGHAAIAAAMHRKDSDKLKDINNECGMGSNRKESAVVIHSMYT